MSERKIDIKRRGKMMGWIGALAVHLMLIIGLLLAGFSIPEPAEEGGMPVLLGQVPEAGGESQLVPVEVAPATEPAEPSSEPASSVPDEAPLITQEEEESAPVKPTPKQEKKKPTPTPTPQPSAAERAEAERKRAEAEKKRVEEARKRAEEEAARKKREAEEATRKAPVKVKASKVRPQATATREPRKAWVAMAASPWRDAHWARVDYPNRHTT